MVANHWIGVDLGGTKLLAGLFADDLSLLTRAKLATDVAGGPAGIFTQIRQIVDDVASGHRLTRGDIKGVGVCIPGQVDAGTQRVRFAPNLNWTDVDLTKVFPADWSIPCFFENDVKLGTYGEFALGAAVGAKHVLGIFVGTGVGGGLIINGELYNGFKFSAGEIGHTVLHWRKGTSLEDMAGRHAMMKRAADLLKDAPKLVRKAWKGVDLLQVKSSQLASLVQKGDPIAMMLVDDGARALGAAVASALNLLSPEVIVIGGGVAGALGEPFLERIWEVAQKFALPHVADGVRFVPAALADDSGIYGAAAFARNEARKLSG